MSIETDFLNFLQSISGLRKNLYKRLGTGKQDVNAYYLCSREVLFFILEEGIKCRNSVKRSGAAFSGSAVQSRREKPVYWLARDREKRKNIHIHDCVNLFWNPLNQTFWAFQRNALLTAGDGDNETVCIIEIDIGKILKEKRFFWGVSRKNLASDRYIDHRIECVRGFQWRTIFSASKAGSSEEHKVQSAEILLYSDSSTLVPPSYIKRVIVSHPGYLSTAERDRLKGKLVFDETLYDKPNTLLGVELDFVANVLELETLGVKTTEIICESMRTLCEFEQTHCGPEVSMFASSDVAQHYLHGVSHVTRVMFWVSFLYRLPTYIMPRGSEITAIAAALIHDLARTSNSEDLEHGQAAVNTERYRTLTEDILSNDEDRESCHNAVVMHCRQDDDCLHKDVVWQLLKDADAIDRGRFGRSKTSGCDPSQLRGLAERDATSKSVLTMAYNFARMTKHVEWGGHPCRKLLEVILSKLKRLDEQKISIKGKASTRSKPERDVVMALIHGLTGVENHLGVIDQYKTVG